MTSPVDHPTHEVSNEDDNAVIARYGIVRVPADRYEIDGFRYSSLKDAVAQAKRNVVAATGAI